MPKKSAGFECDHCGQPEPAEGGMKVCARCRRTRYCSKSCQAAHWKKGGHRTFCIPPEACKPCDQPLEDRKAEIVCVICMGTTGKTYRHACRVRVHLTCLAQLFEHCKDKLTPPCPLCRAPLPPIHDIFDYYADLGHFQECKELHGSCKDIIDVHETKLWILEREATYHSMLGRWEEAVHSYKHLLDEIDKRPLTTQRVKMRACAKTNMQHAEQERDQPKKPFCLAKYTTFFDKKF